AVGVTRHEVGGLGLEGDVATVVADRGAGAVPVALASVAGHADPFVGPRDTVVHEHINRPVGVGLAGHLLLVTGVVDDETAVAADRMTQVAPLPAADGRRGHLTCSAIPHVDADGGA